MVRQGVNDKDPGRNRKKVRDGYDRVGQNEVDTGQVKWNKIEVGHEVLGGRRYRSLSSEIETGREAKM